MDDDKFAGVRTQRASLGRAFTDVERALAAPLTGRSEQWQARLAVCLDDLQTAWTRHVGVTEGADGLFAQIKMDAPQLAPKLSKLHAEHEQIDTELTEIRKAVADRAGPDGDVADVRSRATAVLAGVMRHRQRGADIVYEAYAVDIGGE